MVIYIFAMRYYLFLLIPTMTGDAPVNWVVLTLIERVWTVGWSHISTNQLSDFFSIRCPSVQHDGVTKKHRFRHLPEGVINDTLRICGNLLFTVYTIKYGRSLVLLLHNQFSLHLCVWFTQIFQMYSSSTSYCCCHSHNHYHYCYDYHRHYQHYHPNYYFIIVHYH